MAAMGALLPTRIRLDPAPGPLMEKYWLSPAGNLRLHLLPNLADTYEYNQRVLRRIATPLRVAVISPGPIAYCHDHHHAGARPPCEQETR